MLRISHLAGSLVAAALMLGVPLMSSAEDQVKLEGNMVIQLQADGAATQPVTFTFGGAGGTFVLTQASEPSETELFRKVQELNMKPDFTLTADQKTKIQAARDQFSKALATWKKDNKQALEKIEKDLADANTAQDQAKIADATQAQKTLNDTAPKAADMDEKIKALLTDEQKKAVEETEKGDGNK